MAITAPLLWLDGERVRSEDATAPLMGHALQRGSLVFDVGSFHPTKKRPALFRAPDHVARFLRSASIVGLEVPFRASQLVDAAAGLVAEHGGDAGLSGLVRWSVFFAATSPDLIPRDRAVHVAVAVQSLQDPPGVRPIRVAVFDDARKAPPEALSPETKASAAYLGPMLARQRAIAAGADEVVLVDLDGNIAEAPIANAFAVVGGTLWTPPLGRILPGITRDSVISLAQSEGIAIREAPLPPADFLAADEAFLTATSLPIAPIAAINARILPAAPGPITTRLLARMSGARRGDDPERTGWVLPVHRAG